MSELASIRTERDRQAHKRWKLMFDLMHRRDTDVCKRMVDLMTTVQNLTQGVKTVVTQTAAVLRRYPPTPVAFNSTNVPPTSAFPTQQLTYYSQSQQTKQPQLPPPAVYNGQQTKSQVPKAIQTDLRFCEVSQAHQLSTLLPEVLRRLNTITLWPAAK